MRQSITPQLDLYHATTLDQARSICTRGFEDATDRTARSGVRLSDRPLDGNELPGRPNVVLRVTLGIDDCTLADYEWHAHGKGYREWVVPAALVTPHAEIEPLCGICQNRRAEHLATPGPRLPETSLPELVCSACVPLVRKVAIIDELPVELR